MYRIWSECQTEVKSLGYFGEDIPAKAAFNRFILRYYRQGYSCDEAGEDKELAELMRNIVKGDDMWSLTMVRVPIVADKEDRVIIHLDL